MAKPSEDVPFDSFSPFGRVLTRVELVGLAFVLVTIAFVTAAAFATQSHHASRELPAADALRVRGEPARGADCATSSDRLAVPSPAIAVPSSSAPPRARRAKKLDPMADRF